jgi:hypothetical protein
MIFSTLIAIASARVALMPRSGMRKEYNLCMVIATFMSTHLSAPWLISRSDVDAGLKVNHYIKAYFYMIVY